MTRRTPKQWIRSPADERAVREGYWFDSRAADRPREFMRRFCRHSKGVFAGSPFELLPWQWRDVVGPLFGWKRPDGLRRYRRAYLEIGKKNGKSTLASGLVLFLFMADDEPGAEIYIAAADRAQAGIIYHEAASMVEKSPSLNDRIIVVHSQKRLAYPPTDSVVVALSADVPTKEGLNAHAVIFDELHAQRTYKLWDTLIYASASRRQPLHISITTAGDDVETICYEQHEYAQKVISGAVYDPAFLGVIYAADETDDWQDPKTWRKANPSLGVTMTMESFEEDAKRAEDSPRALATFKRYRLNLWPTAGQRWGDMQKWDACVGPEVDETGIVLET